MITSKIHSLNEKSPFRLWTVMAILAMAITGLSCSDDEPEKVVKDTPVPQEAPPAPVKEVCVYQHANYEGWEKCFTADEPKFVPLGINDQVSSVKVKGGAKAELFQHHDFQGFSRVYEQDIPFVGADNDQFSALKIK